ncbi:unnamed protein product [Trypanosoma congolense IL3000]|uniref:WGS project CAEQ00000000 data, annotated contig 1655 n=1 Tax=Trypanosoma congolense (strain IL3000) TaxID=1068625 RepID=F9W7U6_TRYCI|nr:unnamed protein product [Trypanosoma congolense IL3000]
MSVKGSIWLGTPLVEGSSDCDSPFTSKIGGSAMLFRETSDYSAFRCPKCKGINNVSLLAQIYAPLDVYDRIVYVFLCAYCSKGGSSYCFVLRSQNFNPSYVHTSPGSLVNGDCGGAVFAENDDWGDDNALLQDDNSSGSLSPSTNIPSKVTDCTEAGVTCDTWTPLPLVSTGTKSPAKGICYPCFVLDIFEEPPKPNVSLDPPTDQLNKAKQKYGEAAVETTVVEDEEEPICEKVLRKYVQRIGRAPSQCVRWGPGQEPLRSSCAPITVPKCPHCMSHRQFELQLTSPIIYFLTKGAEENDHSVHFGNVLVYTCSGNCNTQPYSLEYCFVEVEM